jgi:hypothetical protein
MVSGYMIIKDIKMSCAVRARVCVCTSVFFWVNHFCECLNSRASVRNFSCVNYYVLYDVMIIKVNKICGCPIIRLYKNYGYANYTRNKK